MAFQLSFTFRRKKTRTEEFLAFAKFSFDVFIFCMNVCVCVDVSPCSSADCQEMLFRKIHESQFFDNKNNQNNVISLRHQNYADEGNALPSHQFDVKTEKKKLKFMKKDVVVVYQNNYAESGTDTAHASPSFGRQKSKN